MLQGAEQSQVGVQSTLLCSSCEPQCPPEAEGEAGVASGWKEGCPSTHPDPCRGMGPFGVGSPYWLQVTFLPRNIFGSETHFCMDQHGLGVAGRGAVSTSVRGLSIPMCPSLQVGLDRLHRWGLLPGRLCPPLTFSRPGCMGDLASLPNPAPLRHSHGTTLKLQVSARSCQH